MPQQSRSSGRGTATKSRSRNETPNTPPIRESDYAKLKVDELRAQLKQRGVAGTSTLRKGDLVKSLVKSLRAEARGGRAAPKAAGPAGRPAKRAAAPGGRPANKAAAAGGRGAKKAAPAAAKRAAPAGAKKAAPAAKKGAAAAKKGAAQKTTAAARKGAAAGEKPPAAPARGGVRRGSSSSRTLQYSQEIRSPQDRPERTGRSLVTTDHDVIRQWAEARNGQPATVEGTERGSRPGVLRFDFPIDGADPRLRVVSWDEWFATFDERGLNFIYQEARTDGRQSNFFRLENPNREDA